MEDARKLLTEYFGSERQATAVLLMLASGGLTVVSSDLAGSAWKRMVRP